MDNLFLYYSLVVLAAVFVGWMYVISLRFSKNYKKLCEMMAEPYFPNEGKVIACKSVDNSWQGAQAEFRDSHLSLVALNGDKYTLNLGRHTAFCVTRWEEAPLGVVLEVSDATIKLDILYVADGLGGFLGRCRRAGSKVTFSKLAEKAFGPQLQASIESYLKAPAPPAPVVTISSDVDMVCSACGAKAACQQDAPARTCEYCGSIITKQRKGSA